MRGCFFVNCDTIDAKWATLEAFLVIFKAFCLSVFVFVLNLTILISIYTMMERKKPL